MGPPLPLQLLPFFPAWEEILNAEGGCRSKGAACSKSCPSSWPSQILPSLFSFSDRERKRAGSKTRHRERKRWFLPQHPRQITPLVTQATYSHHRVQADDGVIPPSLQHNRAAPQPHGQPLCPAPSSHTSTLPQGIKRVVQEAIPNSSQSFHAVIPSPFCLPGLSHLVPGATTALPTPLPPCWVSSSCCSPPAQTIISRFIWKALKWDHTF